jgi:hypothetical protein
MAVLYLRTVRIVTGILLVLICLCSKAQNSPVKDSSSQDTLLPYTPYFMHQTGVHVRSRYAYLLEYNLRFLPHTEFKLSGGTADHTHYNLMGFTTTQSLGRYVGIGISLLSKNYFKPTTDYHIQKSIVVSYNYGQGNLNFVGDHKIPGTVFPDLTIESTEENMRYRYSEIRIGVELIIDRVIHFDIYPLQFTYYNITSDTYWPHQYIPAIGVVRNGVYNPGFGMHIIINQSRKKK